MGLTSILRSFASMLLMLSAAMAIPLMLAIAGNEPGVGGWVFGIIASVIAGGGAYAASAGKLPPTDFRGALMVILLWWFVIPAFGAIPFAMNGLGFSDAYFETVAALTTTGGWLNVEDAVASPAGMLWRAELQWLGGLASITIAAAIFIRPAFIGIDTLLPPFSRGDKDSFLRPLKNAVSAFASVYIFVTAFAFCLLALAGASGFDAVIMAMSGIASGGFLPTADGVETFAPSIRAVLFGMMIVSGANFVLIARVLRGAKGRARDMETVAYLVILFVVAVFYWLLSGAQEIQYADRQIFNAASMLSTNGYIFQNDAPPLIVLLVTAIIGGAAVSTAGGFKILRWLVIMRRAREEIERLIMPSAITGRRRVANELGVWIHFLVFTMFLAVLVVAFSIGGHTLDMASAVATAAMSNAGPLIQLAEGGGAGYEIFSEPLRWLLVIGMVLGRLEGAVALALVNRAFWRFV